MKRILSLKMLKQKLTTDRLRNVMTLLMLLVGINASAVVVTIPSANTNGTGGTPRFPYTNWFGYTRTALIYLPTEIGTSGNITSIGFYLNSISGALGNSPVQIYMKHVAVDNFSANTTVATEIAGATLVYDNTIPLTSFVADNWITATLSTPFAYNGTSNLEIIVFVNHGGGGSGEGSTARQFRYSSTSSVNRLQYWNADTNPPTGNGTRLTNRQNVQLNIVPPPCSAVPTAATVSTTTASFTCSGAPILNATNVSTGSNVTYQWETSLAGQNNWSDVGGALTGSPAFTAPVIAASRDYRMRTTCPTFGTTMSSNIVTVTVNTTVNAGTATTATPSIICSGGASLNATGLTAGNGMQYQWQSSPAGQGIWTLLGTPGASPAYVSPTISANTDYRVVSTCGPAFTSNVSSPVAVTVQSVNITPLTATICAGNSQALQVAAPLPTTLFSQDFNSGTTGLTFTNTSTGTTPAAATWTLRPNNYSLTASGGPYVFSPGSQFILSNSDGVGSGANVLTTMTTDPISTSNYSSLTLTFRHFYRDLGNSFGRVEVWNGTAWVQVANYTDADFGSLTNFANASINLTPYINVPNLQVRFTYSAAWDWWWAIDDIQITGTPVALTSSWTATTGGGLPAGAGTPSAANNNITVTPTAGAGNYTYTVNTNYCGTRNATVTVNPAPTATIAAGAAICAGQTGTLNFTGTSGNIVYFHEGSSTTVLSVTIPGAGNIAYTTSALTANTVFTVDSIKNTTCTVLSSLTATQVVNPRPQATLAGNVTVCKNAPATIGLNSTSTSFPMTITYTDGTNNYTEPLAGAGNIAVPSNVPGTYTYTITALTDANNCAGIAGTDLTGSSTVEVKALPDVTVTSNDAAVCEGDPTTINFTFSGDAPFIFNYFDGTNNGVSGSTNTNTFSFPVNVSAATTYYVEYLQDANPCIATPVELGDSTTVTIHDTALITVQPQATITACSQNNAVISMTATGYNLAYTWYENGNPVSLVDPNYTITGNTLSINNVSGLGGNTYYVEVQGACGPMQTSATTTLTENLSNDWSGQVSSDWDNGMNWSCGTVPIVTTNVLIPAGVPNMPAVNIPGAVCNNLTIDATASVTFAATNNQLSVHGNILNNGTLDGTNGTVELAGAAQSISGAAVFNNLDVNGGGVKTLGGNLIVNGILDLNSGLLELGNNNIYLTQPTAQLGGNPSSYIITNGTGVVVGANMGAVGGNPDGVNFHVGINNTSYTPIALENLGDADSFSVRVIENVYQIGDDITSPIVTNPVVTRTWMVNENTTGGSIVNMTPMWNSPLDQTVDFDQSHVFVSHYLNNEWISYVDSANAAPVADAGPFLGMLQTTQDSIENFSPFTVASAGQFPLSIRLNSIVATNVGPRNKVQWTSSKEDKGDIYELESSADGKQFTKIATVAANGTPSSYTQWDENPVQGVNYYRVKLLNNNGTFSYSKVVTATVKGKDGFAIEAYPNPVSSTVSVKVNGVVKGNATVVITDVTGKVVMDKVQVVDNNATINVSNLASGIYMINYADDARNESIKITKQ